MITKKMKQNSETMKLNMPKDVRYIIHTLEDAGFEAFAVGGCVRDSLLSRKPQDWDITTNAKPSDVQKRFRRTIATGIAHGTVTIMMGENGYEVTTYRIDGDYSDGRHPDSIAFTDELIKDLRRRDFTINAMAYSEKTGLVDAFGGVADLKDGIIRCVGEARERFGEDALRILRAIRFQAQLGFDIEEDTKRAVHELCDTLQKISKERIMIELTKLILSDNPQCLENVFLLGLDPYIAKQFSRLKDSDFEEMAKLSRLPKQKHLHFSYLLKGWSKDAIIDLLKELKLDNDNISKIQVLASYLEQELPKSRTDIKYLLSGIGAECLDDLICLRSIGFPGLTEDVTTIRETKADILRKHEPYTLKDLQVNGGDLLQLGFKQGPQIRECLEELLHLVIEYPQCNEKAYLLQTIKDGIYEGRISTK